MQPEPIPNPNISPVLQDGLYAWWRRTDWLDAVQLNTNRAKLKRFGIDKADFPQPP